MTFTDIQLAAIKLAVEAVLKRRRPSDAEIAEIGRDTLEGILKQMEKS